MLREMSLMEEFNGCTRGRIYDHWYELKRSLAQSMATETKGQQDGNTKTTPSS